MFWLSTSTVIRLRDQLRAAGQRASVAVDISDASEASAATQEAMAVEFRPFCEAMYLMMSADGDVSTEEREVLRGALKNLSGSALDGDSIEKMLENATESAATEGRDTRLREVISELGQDKARAEVAFVLAAAIAFADNAIADEENETLDAIADGLGIDETRADELLDAVEKDLGSA